MLCINRSENQSVVITVPASQEPTTIIYTMRTVQPDGKCWHAFTAPERVTINRREIQDQIAAGLGLAYLISKLTDEGLIAGVHGLEHPKEPRPPRGMLSLDGYGGAGSTLID